METTQSRCSLGRMTKECYVCYVRLRVARDVSSSAADDG